MAYVLGIDIGTGSAKAVAVDLQGKAVEVAQQYYSFQSPKPGYHEQDPEQIWFAFLSCVKEVISKTGVHPTAISLSSAMHSLIPVSEHGMPLAPMITWADNRSAEIAKRLQASNEGLSVYKATGTPLHAMSPLCKLIWLKENEPLLFEKTFKFISIKEYIWYKLFQEFKIDYSIASCTGLFDIYGLKWHSESLDLAGIIQSKLSDPVKTNYSKTFKVNQEDKDLNFLMSDVTFVIGASDGCLSNLGSMANEAGVAVLTIGTSGAIRISSNRPLPNLKAMTFSYILDDTTFVCGGPINNGGLALQWWLKNYGPSDLKEKDYEQFFKEISSINPGSDGLLFLPYLTGERAPIWDSESCGVFFGVKLQHTLHHFSRAVLEGICFAMKDVLEAVQENSDPITQINIGGGFVTSDLWVQLLADITGKKLVIAQHEDASAVGAAYLAMKTMNMISHYPTSNQLDLNTINPDLEKHKKYNKHFEVYRRLYSDLQETMHFNHQLNDEVS
jgi:gluconokinase